jgi:small-conductance mechanosensitive channel
MIFENLPWLSFATGLAYAVSGFICIVLFDHIGRGFLFWRVFNIFVSSPPTTKTERNAWQIFHATFHTIHGFVFFVVVWSAITQIVNENQATKLFQGLAVGVGIASQTVLADIVAFFRLSMSGEVREGCKMTIGEDIEGFVEDIGLFHVILRKQSENETKFIYVSNSSLLSATFVITPIKCSPNTKCNVQVRPKPFSKPFSLRPRRDLLV